MRERCTHIVHKALAVVRPQFRLDFADGVHGLPHWSRVWFHGRALAAASDIDPALLA
jgi:HD superfamily phosphodiesterase